MNTQVSEFICRKFTKGTYQWALRKYLRHKIKAGVSIRTVEKIYFNLVRIGKKWGDKPLAKMDRQWVNQYVEHLWLDYAYHTVRSIIGDLRAFCLWCKKKKHHKQNLAKQVKPLDQNKNVSRRLQAVPEGDVSIVIDYLANQLRHLVYRDLFKTLVPVDCEWSIKEIRLLRDLFCLVFLYETGCRVGELARLSSLAMDNATKQPSKAYMVLVIGKTNVRERRFTEATAELWRLLQQKRHDPNSKYAVSGYRDTLMLPNGISQMIRRNSKRAGVKPFGANSLRHAKVKRCRQTVGMDMAKVLLDHDRLDTTWNYAGIENDEIQAATLITGLKDRLF